MSALFVAFAAFLVMSTGFAIARGCQPAIKSTLARLLVFVAGIQTIVVLQRLFRMPPDVLHHAGAYLAYMLIGGWLLSRMLRSD